VQVPRCRWRSKALDEAPYKLSGAVTRLVSITFLSLAFSYWIDIPWFRTEGKLAVVLIKPSLGVSNWPVIYFINYTPTSSLALFNTAPSTSFLVPLPGKKKTSARGVSHAHPLLCFKFCFTLFLLVSFYQKHKKISFLTVVFTCLILVLLEWVLMRTPSCVTLLALIIVILSALLLRHLFLLLIFMRLSLLC
jgi:hypothetical protein